MNLFGMILLLLQPLLLACLVTQDMSVFAIATLETAYPSPYDLDEPCTTVDAVASAEADDRILPQRDVHGDGRIVDISHKYHVDMPSWESDGGLGQFLWLTRSMKNGSVANFSEMKMGAHTGTHVDAPGHVYDCYFESGFDVDTLDLEVLNGRNNQSRF